MNKISFLDVICMLLVIVPFITNIIVFWVSLFKDYKVDVVKFRMNLQKIMDVVNEYKEYVYPNQLIHSSVIYGYDEDKSKEVKAYKFVSYKEAKYVFDRIKNQLLETSGQKNKINKMERASRFTPLFDKMTHYEEFALQVDERVHRMFIKDNVLIQTQMNVSSVGYDPSIELQRVFKY